MNSEGSQKHKGAEPIIRMLIFPASVVVLYGILFAIMPDKAFLALKSSGNVLLSIVGPLLLVFVVMMIFNVFVKPGQIAKFLGAGSGAKGIILSATAGIISVGPIYAWYPLLKELRQKGAGNSPLAVFLYNRAIKLPLLPIMVAYFGWAYVLILSVLTVLGSIATGYAMGVLLKYGRDLRA